MVILAIVTSACGAVAPAETLPVAPEQPVQEPEELPELPEAFINGVPGHAASWSWHDGIVDGFVSDPSILPAVGRPIRLALAPGWRVEGVSAVMGEGTDQQTRAVPHEGNVIGEVRADAVMLNVFVRFENWGEASYYWALIPPDGGSSGDVP